MKKISIMCYDLAKGGITPVANSLYHNLKINFDTEMVYLGITEKTDKISIATKLVTIQGKYPKIISGLVYAFIGIPKYLHYLQKEKPVISLSFGLYDNIINTICCNFSRTKAVISYHGSRKSAGMYSPLIKMLEIIARAYFNIFSKQNIIVVSNGLGDEYSKEYGFNRENIKTIYNPLDINRIEQQSCESVTEAFFQTELPIIIAVGNEIPVKGHWHLLRVFERICNEIPCKLIICGNTERDAAHMSYIRSLVDTMKYKKNVLFTGWTDNPYKYMKKADIFVLSSLSEGLPYVVLESLVCKCPVISTSCCAGVREMLNDGEYGIITDELDGCKYSMMEKLSSGEISLLNNIRYLLMNPELRNKFREKGRKRADDFRSDKIIKEYTDYFKMIIGECCDYNA